MLANPKHAPDDHRRHALWMREVSAFDSDVLHNEEAS